MSQAINLWTFIGLSVGYLLASIIIHLAIAFTIPAWIIYFFTLLPSHLIGAIFLIGLGLVQPKNRKTKIRYQKLLLYPIVIFQILTILLSPASCYGWKQGQACYSLLQSLVMNVKNNPPHWNSDSWFIGGVSLYVLSTVIFLATIRIKKQQSE